MVIQTWGDIIFISLQQVWSSIALLVPMLFGALLIFFIGLVIAITLGQLVEQIVRGLKINDLLRKLDLEKTLEKAGWRMDAAGFLGALVKWFFVIVFLLAAANILGLTQVGDFLRDVLMYLPNVIIAALILIIAAIVADLVEKVLRGSLMAMGRGAHLAVPLVRWSIWIFAFIAALLQLGIAVTLIQTFVTGIVAAMAIATGLAFGLGGKDAAAQFIDRVRGEIRR
ncbi:MAG: hypothetical protein AAB972_04625 [Patescibacteria group bacterium]